MNELQQPNRTDPSSPGNPKPFHGLQAIYLVDTKGLVTNTRGDKLPHHKQFFSRTDGAPDMKVRPLPKLEGVTRV